MPSAAKISTICYHLPDTVLDNHELERVFSDWSADKILAKTGIAERRIAGPSETAGDLAFHAAEKLFACDPGLRERVDFILLCTQAPDYYLPTTACVLQHRLGLPTTAGALDINLGCSGYVYGLALAKGLVEAGIRRNVLLLTADTYSKFIHPLDRSVRSLFGDGASATLIEGVAQAERSFIGPFVLGSDGKGAQNLIVPAGGARLATSADTAKEVVDSSGHTRSQDHLYMNGAEIMQFTLTSVPAAFREVLAKAELTLDDIDAVVFHQANGFMLEALRKKIKIPDDKFIVELADVGNTVSSTIPIAIARALEKNKIKAGQRLLLLGFGVGYSWGGTLVEL